MKLTKFEAISVSASKMELKTNTKVAMPITTCSQIFLEEIKYTTPVCIPIEKIRTNNCVLACIKEKTPFASSPKTLVEKTPLNTPRKNTGICVSTEEIRFLLNIEQ